MDSPDLLNELAYEFVERMRRGEQPSVEEFARLHPELAAEIQDLFPALVLVEQLDPLARSAPAGKAVPAIDSPAPTQLGEYRILRPIGRGGMGVVYEAVQESLGRHVALKVLSSNSTTNAVLLERFKREAQAAAQLHHTNIVPVYMVGEDRGYYFYAMQLIEGQSLDRVLRNACVDEQHPSATIPGCGDRDYYQAVARLGAQAADALASAHASGVLHRDVKPANLLLDVHGNVWVSDFGLARLEGLGELTQTEDVLGTLRYVPPERFRGVTDARGDVYSLGLSLYELLTREPVFDGVTRAETIHQILHIPPPAPRSLDPRIPRDLETIVLKSIASEPQRRYASAADMADDLRRFVADAPILARRLSPVERYGRWCRKNPVLAAVGSLAGLLLVSVAIISAVAYYREDYLADSLQQALQRTREAEIRGRNDLFAAYVANAQAAQVSRRQGQRLDSLAAVSKAVQLLPSLGLTADERQKKSDQLRDLATTSLTLLDVRQFGRWPADVDTFRLNRFAIRDQAGTLIVKQWPEGGDIARLQNVNEHTSFAFTPDPEVLLLFDQQASTLHRWRLYDPAAECVAQLGEFSSGPPLVRFSRDGQRVILVRTREPKKMIEVLDWPGGRCCFRRESEYVGTWTVVARLSADGRFVATFGGESDGPGARTVTVLDAGSGRELATLQHPRSVCSVAWHPDSQTLAVGLTDSNEIVLWNVPERKRLYTLTEQRGGGPTLSMNSTGQFLASYSLWTRQALDFWHPYTGKSILHLSSPFQMEWTLADGRVLGNAKDERGDWNFAMAEPSPVVQTLVRNPLHGPVASWRNVAVHAAGRLLAVGSDDGVSLFDLETSLDVGRLAVGHALDPWFIPDTGELLTYSEQGLLRWPVTISAEEPTQVTVGPPAKLPVPAYFGAQVCSDHSGQFIAVGAGSRAIVLQDFGRRVMHFDGLTDCRRIAISPDGKWLVTTNHGGGAVYVWDVRTGKAVYQTVSSTVAATACFSPDGTRLSCSGFSPNLMQTGTWQRETLPSGVTVGFDCYSPDGRLAIDLPGPGKLYDAHSGRLLGTLDLPDSPIIWHATFTPDGRHIVLSSNEQQSAYVWDLRQLTHELSLLGLGWDVPANLRSPPPATIENRQPLVVRIVAG